MPMLDHDVPLYYTEAGAGEPILFCHGAGGNAASWFNQFGEFAGDYRCIAYDCRGFGRSTCTARMSSRSAASSRNAFAMCAVAVE